MFDKPIVLFIFKRMKAVDVVREIAKVQPRKLYIIADGPRTPEEKVETEACRKAVKAAVDWDCEIIQNYADVNRGVYQNIGEGAKWVFSRESEAIFLEDDNLPEVTFFRYCEEMLNKYEKNDKVLWICGTNYLESYPTREGYSYFFTRHMLPCGWASWSSKFLRYYDGYLDTLKIDNISNLKKYYYPRSLYNTMKNAWMGEYVRMQRGQKASSWDYQMDYSIKANGLYGICPAQNQIRNIGVDDYSIHGGNTKKKVMTDRFCEKKTYPLSFPLKGPTEVEINSRFERQLGKIILPPIKNRIIYSLTRCLRNVLHIPYNVTTKEYLRNAFHFK